MKELNSQMVFRSFYDITHDRLYRIIYYYIKREEWSQEIVFDVFLEPWEQRSSLPQIEGIENYCFILVKNALLSYLKKENRRATVFIEVLPEPEAQGDSSEESMISEELFAIYVKVLDRLPERYREVFICIHKEKRNYVQAAEELGISTKTADVQLQEATVRLKEAILTMNDKQRTADRKRWTRSSFYLCTPNREILRTPCPYQ